MQLLEKLIYQNESIPENQKKYILFHFKCLLYDGSKFLLFLLFFLFIGGLDMYIYAFIIMLPLRLTSGGLHFKHYWSCLLFSFGYMLLVTVPLATVRLPYGVSIIMLLLCIIINGSTGPICSASRPALPPNEIMLARKKAVILTVYAAILTILFWNTALAPVGFWSVVLHSVQLIIGNLLKKRGAKTC